MAHSLRTKARCMAMLMSGDSTRHVSDVTGVPRTTVRRWKRPAYQLLRDCLQQSERGRALLEMARQMKRARLKQNGPKKENLSKPVIC